MNNSDGAPIPNWVPVVAAIFTFLTIGSLFYLIVGPEIAPSKHIIFDVWMAFCLAASVSFIGGTAHAKGSIPFFRDSPIQFMAIGGVAVFLVSLLVLHKIYP